MPRKPHAPRGTKRMIWYSCWSGPSMTPGTRPPDHQPKKYCRKKVSQNKTKKIDIDFLKLENDPYIFFLINIKIKTVIQYTSRNKLIHTFIFVIIKYNFKKTNNHLISLHTWDVPGSGKTFFTKISSNIPF